MLKHLYADNFRCLVNFDVKLDRMVLLLGENGVGKTTVFDLIRRLQRFLLGQLSVRSAFPATTLTRWQTKTTQNFEFELQVDTDLYLYRLTIEHEAARRPAVQREILRVNGSMVFTVEEGMAHLPNHGSKVDAQFPFDPGQSVVGSFLPSADTHHLTRFKEEIEKIVVCSLEPMNMFSKSEAEVHQPLRSMKDFVSWYRYLSQEYQGSIFNLSHELRAVLPGFHSFSLKEVGENIREMRVHFQLEEAAESRTSYAFRELSDGQRVLIVLYTLLYGLEDRGAYLFLDEPENFVALREIQPWLTALYDRVGGGVKQAVLISHHPEIIDYLGTAEGRWFDRSPNGPVRVGSQPPGSLDSPLSLSETMARGWDK